MAVKHEILSQQEFCENMKSMPPEEREAFRDWQLYQLSVGQEDIKNNCINCNPGKKQNLFNATGAAGFCVAVIVGVLNWMNRGT
jgi:hypothetical protein